MIAYHRTKLIKPPDDYPAGLNRRYQLPGSDRDTEKNHELWRLDRIELKSVGIDIGSSTTHMVFSTLVMRRQAMALSSRFELTDRRIDFESDILITPFSDNTNISTEDLQDFFENCYHASCIKPTEIQTGAVITTGDAARKDNANAIIQLFSEQAGQFVCASAGPLLESKMAAYGSGAVAQSTSNNGGTILNIDMGGGTTKFATVSNGNVTATAAINVGARLVTFDQHRMITKIEPAAQIVANHQGVTLTIGEELSHAHEALLVHGLTIALLEVAAHRPLSVLSKKLLITKPLSYDRPISAVFFSGGVSEYLYNFEKRSFNDLGIKLGKKIRELTPSYLEGVPIEISAERIRATVIGASQFTAQVSGNTIYLKNPKLLPLRNLKVVIVDFNDTEGSLDKLSNYISQAIVAAELGEPAGPLVLALRWPFGPAFEVLRNLCIAISEAVTGYVAVRAPIILVLDCDLARLIGANLSEVLDDYQDLLCIDGIQLEEFDYIDIGEPHPDAGVVTVVIKSLVFTG